MKTIIAVVIGLTVTSCGTIDPLIDRIQTTKIAVGDLELNTIYALTPFTNSPIPVYLWIVNNGSTADSLLEVRSPAATQIKMHGGDMSAMSALSIPAGNSLAMEPGGLHLMLMPPTPDFVRGDTVEVTLRFARTGEVSLMVPVIEHVDVDVVR